MKLLLLLALFGSAQAQECCQGAFICPSMWDPQCGSDGCSYGNACEATSCGGTATPNPSSGPCVSTGTEEPVVLPYTPPSNTCFGDVTSDGTVDVADVMLGLSSFQIDDGADTDSDGDTDMEDVLAILGNWGCNTGGGDDLPPGLAAGRPFFDTSSMSTFSAAAVEVVDSDWIF